MDRHVDKLQVTCSGGDKMRFERGNRGLGVKTHFLNMRLTEACGGLRASFHPKAGFDIFLMPAS